MNSTVWHECGHAIFCNIFKDLMVIQKITIEPGEYGTGGNLITVKKDYLKSPVDAFRFVVANIAGLVVEFTHNKRNDIKVLESILLYLNKRMAPNDNTKDSFDGDLINMTPAVEYLCRTLKTEKFKVLASAVIYINNILTQLLDLWNTVDVLAKELSVRKTLLEGEIEKIFNSTGFNPHIKKNQTLFMAETIRLLGEINR
jgi:hypothetical protein